MWEAIDQLSQLEKSLIVGLVTIWWLGYRAVQSMTVFHQHYVKRTYFKMRFGEELLLFILWPVIFLWVDISQLLKGECE